MKIILALLIFSLIVVFHELGHFLLAKKNGITVTEFSLGMGPRLLSHVWGETRYSIKLLPFGGSCLMVGEDEDSDDVNAFNNKPVGARIAVVAAGPVFNFILAFVLALILLGMAGYDKAEISNLEAGMPMAEAGFQDGDVIKEFDGKHIVVNRELSYYLMFHPLSDAPVTITMDRNGQEITQTVTPKLVKDDKGNESYRMGFAYGTRERIGGLNLIKYSAYEVKFWICTTVESLGQMIKGRVSAKDVSGPVGIVQAVGNVVQESKADGIKYVILNILSFGIMLTANLGVMNLLPIPALDGGRLLFLIIEGIRRKPLPEKFENYVNVGGFMLLMGLMVVILANDILKIIH